MIALLIGYEAISRFIEPVSIHFTEAIPIAVLGLAVNVASAWLLGAGDHHHGHDHSHDDNAHDDHDHGAAHRANNMRAAVIHVLADAAVVGLLLARLFGWLWMDPLAGFVGACVIASWSYGLIRDTGAILLDMNPDRHMAEHLREAIESDGTSWPICICGVGTGPSWSHHFRDHRQSGDRIFTGHSWRGSMHFHTSRSKSNIQQAAWLRR